LDYAADTGAANAYAIALSPALTSHVAGLPLHFKAANANTGAATLAVNGLTAVAIKQVDGSALPAGAILAGQMCTVIYTGSVYMLVSMVLGANTPPQFDNDTSIATTAFVQRALGNYAGVRIVTATETIPAADAGKVLLVNIASGGVVTLPAYASVVVGATFYIQCGLATGSITITAPAGMTLTSPNGPVSGGTSMLVQPGVAVECVFLSSTTILVTNGAGAASLANNGYQKLPSGLIVQWGLSTNTGTITAVTFPLAFPANLCGLTMTAQSASLSGRGPLLNYASQTVSGFSWGAESAGVTITTAGAVAMRWIATGY
jgi:hypothetical protein